MSAIAPLIGGIIGSYFGPIGYLIGSTIGSLLFPPKGKDAQPLQNLKLQGSSFGVMIPVVYGTMRIGGQVVWQTDLTSHAQHASSGKGGDTAVSGYTYTVSFAVKICKGPMGGLRKIWADGELVYDTSIGSVTNNRLIPITIYLGDETASPDPTIEAVLGVGNAPAFLDDMTIVFNQWDVTRYGSRIPVLNFEVFSPGGAIPWRYSSFTPPHQGSNAQYVSGAKVNANVLTIALWSGGTSGSNLFTLDRYTLTGTHIDQPVSVSIPVVAGGASSQWYAPCTNDPTIAFGVSIGPGNTNVSGWFVNGGLVSGPPVVPVSGGDDINSVYTANGINVASLCRLDDNLYAIGSTLGGSGTVWVAQYPCANGIPSASPTASHTIGSANVATFAVSAGDDGFIYVLGDDGTTPSSYVLLKLDTTLTVVRGWTAAQFTGWSATLARQTSFVVYQGLLYFQSADPVSGDPVGDIFRISNTAITRIASTFPAAVGNAISIGNGLVLGPDGIISLNPQAAGVTLASIVTDISARCGRTASEIDVTALTDIVDGFALTQQADGRGNLKPLQDTYFFDGVESSTVIKFVKRGGTSVISIPDGDLAAESVGATSPALLPIVRTEEELLPQRIDLKFVNGAADYQDGDVHAERQVTLSKMAVTASLAINMTAAKAAQVAWSTLFNAWAERDAFTFQVSRQYNYLEPCDVVIAHGRLMRIIKQTQTVSHLVKYDALAIFPSTYNSGPTADAGTTGFRPTTPPTGGGLPSQLQLLDIPLVADADSPGIYVAGATSVAGTTWPGEVVYKSTDAGTTYNPIDSESVARVIGRSSSILPNFGDGNVFDEVSKVTIVIGAGGGTLSSATAAAVLNGANMAVLGNELLQFKNAVLVSGSTYTVSGFLRGRRGTEWAMAIHSANDVFVLLPVTDIATPSSEFGLARLYKGVTSGQAVSAAGAQTFTYKGIAQQCYSPVLLGGGIGNSNDVVLNWVRRTRIGGAWMDLIDAPVSETSEAYVVQIWDSTYTLCARVITGVTAQTLTYTSAQQVTDFGANQATIFFTVGQVGLFGLGQQAAGTAVGGGVSNVNPLAPVSPYGASPTGGPPSVCSGATFTQNLGSTHTVVHNTGAGPGTSWLLTFTTPATGSGRIVIAEWIDGPNFRTGTLGTGPCSAPFGPNGCVITGTTLGFYFYVLGNPYPGIYPTLAPSTQYTITVTQAAFGGAFAEYSPAP